MKVHIQCCQRCFLHKNYNHQEYEFHNHFAKSITFFRLVADFLQKKNSVQVLKNNKQFLISKHQSKTFKGKKIYSGNSYDQKAQDNINSKGKARIQSFQIYFKDFLIYSKLSNGQFPNNKVYLSNVISVLQRIQEPLYLKSIISKMGLQSVHQYISYKLPEKIKQNKTIHYKQIYQVLTKIDFVKPFTHNKQNICNQINQIKISKKKRKKSSQTFQSGEHKFEQFFEPIQELQDQNSKVVTPDQIQQIKTIKSKVLIKKSKSIERRKLSSDSINNFNQNVQISSKRSSENKDKLLHIPKQVNFARVKYLLKQRIRCKKYSTRYSNLNQKTQIINNLVSKQYNKIKESKYQYLSRQMDIFVEYQTSTNQFILQALSDSQDQQNQGILSAVFNKYKKKLSNFCSNYVSSVSQPNFFVSGQINQKSDESSKPSFNNSIGLNSMVISSFQSKILKQNRISIMGQTTQKIDNSCPLEPKLFNLQNQSNQKSNRIVEEKSCMSIQFKSQNQFNKQQIEVKESTQTHFTKHYQSTTNQQNKNYDIVMKQESRNFEKQSHIQASQEIDKNQLFKIQFQPNLAENNFKQQNEQESIQVIEQNTTNCQNKQVQQNNLKVPQNLNSNQIQQVIQKSKQQKSQSEPIGIVQILTLNQIGVCINWLANNYLQLIMTKFSTNFSEDKITMSIFNLLSNKLEHIYLNQDQVKFLRIDKNDLNFIKNLKQLLIRILNLIYDVNMLKIQHINLHYVEKILKTFFLFPTISVSSKKPKKLNKIIKSIFFSQDNETKCQNNFGFQQKKQDPTFCKIIGVSQQNEIQCFSKIQIDQNDFSKSILQSQEGDCLVFNFGSFCKKFEQVVLWFINPKYLFQQQSIEVEQEMRQQQGENSAWYLNMQILPNSAANYSHLFICFSSSLKNEQYTKIKIWKDVKLVKQQKNFQKNQVDLSQLKELKQFDDEKSMKRGELMGQIKKKGDFFFELKLDFGNYICQVQKNQGFKNQRLNLLTYCSHSIKIKENEMLEANKIHQHENL